MRGLALAAVLTAAIATTSPADPGLAPSAAATASGLAFGKCIVRSDRAAAIALMEQLPLGGARTAVAGLPLGAATSCRAEAPAELPVMALRGGIAQAMFRRDFVEFGIQPSEAIARLARFPLPVERDTRGAADPLKSLYLLADCVARSDPENTERLMKTNPGSDMEMRVFAALGPLMSACQGQGGRAAFGRLDLRSAITQAADHVNARYWAGEMTYAGPAFRP